MSAPATLLKILPSWLPSQRWYTGKGGTPNLDWLGSWALPGQSGVTIATHIIADSNERRPAVYQVPVTVREFPLVGGEDALIGTIDDEGERRWVYDGPHDRAYTRELLRFIATGASVSGEGAGAEGHALTRVVVGDGTTDVLRGEQSNTSIVYEQDAGELPYPVICKLFRTVQPGENPDVVLQSALFASGSRSVPATLGSIAGMWADPNGEASGHFAFAQQFVTGAEDAWRIALSAAGEARDFTTAAYEIGIATADVHATLLKALPSRTPEGSDIDGIVDGWQVRLEGAVREVPELRELQEGIRRLYASARATEWPSLQRIHGDLHLGQILGMPGGHWVIIDFEGEPMRPLAERSLPDVPLRDVAGMLRSFDYVAGSQQHASGVREWADDCRNAFLDGYVERSGDDVRRHRVLLDAFELDKALYEAVYEAANRPSWLPIPTAAVRRLAERAQSRPVE